MPSLPDQASVEESEHVTASRSAMAQQRACGMAMLRRRVALLVRAAVLNAGCYTARQGCTEKERHF